MLNNNWFLYIPKILFALLLAGWLYLIFSFIFFTEKKVSKDNFTMQGLVNSKIDKNAQMFTIPLFGTYVPNSADIKKSSLNVHLVGIMYSTNSHASQVIIQLENGEEKIYKIGESIDGSAEIKEIYPTKVIILYQGSLESLFLPQEQLQFMPSLTPLKGEE